MRISDWSSDVCSSDLVAAGKADAVLASRAQIEEGLHRGGSLTVRKGPLPAFTSPGWDIGMAVRENSRTLGDAVEEIVSAMAASGEMKALFTTYGVERSEEHTSELQSLMRISYAVFCLNKTNYKRHTRENTSA